MTTWSPELELLARLSRVAPTADDDARARALAAAAPDWDRVLRLAEHHGVAPLADVALARLDPCPAPPAVRARMHALHLSSLRGNLALHAEWLR
ncbi:MAG: nucleotidyltransferase family protein, partial [Gemmatimonadota bacterium]|nr:nucleotidyltransferase family protein [Gemmatimonadota bacterium]